MTGVRTAVAGPGPAVRLLATLLAATYLFAGGWLATLVLAGSLAPGWSAHVVTSGSMAPALRPGDVVLTSPVATEAVQPGSVVTFHDSGALVTHRVVQAHPDGSWTTRGDANPTPDTARLTPDRVVGIGRVVVPLAGYPVHWLRERHGAALAAWIVGTVAAVVLVASRAPLAGSRRAPGPGDWGAR
ncbi:MAG: signal peptidase I [Kineosporiaceae bacterium]